MSPVKRGLQRILRSRRFWLLAGVVLGYFGLLWFLSHLIDARALRRELEEQASYVLGADVSIGKVQTEIRPLGQWRIRLRNIRVENASPDFGTDLMTCRKTVLEGSILDLLGGRWQPRILIKGWTLHLGVTETGRTSFSDLLQPQGISPKAWNQWPLKHIVMEGQDCSLEEGRIHITLHPAGTHLLTTGQLQGRAYYRPAGSVESLNGDLRLDIEGQFEQGAPPSGLDLDISIDGVTPSASGLKGGWQLRAQGRDARLAVLQRLLSLPETAAEARLRSGTLRCRGWFNQPDRPVEFQHCTAELEETSIPALDLAAPFHLTYEHHRADADGPGSDLHQVRLRRPDGRESLLTLRAPPTGAWRLSCDTTHIDLGQLARRPERDSWVNRVLPRLARIHASAESWSVLGVPLGPCRAEFDMQSGDFSASRFQGKLAHGQLDLTTGAVPASRADLPSQYHLQLKQAQAADLLAAVGHLLPPLARLVPARGVLSATVTQRDTPGDNQAAVPDPHLPPLMTGTMRERFAARLPYADLVVSLSIDEEIEFQEPGEHPLLQALWRLPHGLLRAEDKLHGAQGPRPPRATETLTRLRLLEGMLVALRLSQGQVHMDGLIFTRELGLLVLQGVPGPSGGVLLQLRLYPFDAMEKAHAEVVLPALAADALAAARATEAEHGLRLTAHCAEGEMHVTEHYIRDIVQAAAAARREESSPAPRPGPGSAERTQP